ncbi:MAG TPA: outer membrane beta-barrel protein [Acidobacteriaceae bacterium]|nr:outer membrane beta-barrel protein [Acidobacteriaceae bacterium]
MKLRSLAPAVVLLLAAAVSHAQSQGNFGLYLNPYVTRISNSKPETGPFAFLGDNATSRIFWGFQMGGYYDFFHSGPLAAGVTMRFSDQHANNAGIRDFQVGARVAGTLTGTRWNPYVEATIGGASTKPPGATARVSKTAYAVYGGADYTFSRHVDFRAFEIGYGSVTTASNETIGAGNTLPATPSKLLSFSSGLVFRF